MNEPIGQIVSIQSHVAYGYVGNKAASFVLQRMGFEVTAVNTVQFSNHTGYETFSGEVMSPEHLTSVLAGVEVLGVFRDCPAVLSGYQGSVALGEVIVETVRRVQRTNPMALYCCDPVMGDEGIGQFVSEDIAHFIREECMPRADIVTPNAYELGLLTGKSVDAFGTPASIRAACDEIHEEGPSYVLVTSGAGRPSAPNQMLMWLSVEGELFVVEFPKRELPWPPSGSGDATAALFLGFLLQANPPAQALGKTAASMAEIFHATARAGTRELRFVEAQDRMMAPTQFFSVKQVMG